MGDNVSSNRVSYSWIIVLLFLSTSLINYDIERVDETTEFEDFDQLRTLLSSKNSNDWSASASASNPVVVTSIDSAANNEFVIAGIMSGSTTMSMGSSSITSGQNIEPWIAKSDSNGNWLWMEKISITGISQYAEASIGDIAIAPNGDIFATGRFYDSISFGSISLSSTGYYDSWVAKLSSSGQWMWAEALRGNGDYDGTLVNTIDWIQGTSITTDSNSNVIAGGFFLGNTDAGSSGDGINNGQLDLDDAEIYLVKYSNSGSLQWLEDARGQGFQIVDSLISDSSNNIWVGTTLQVSMSFGSVVVTAAANEIPMGIAKIDSAGNWQTAYATSGSGEPNSIGFAFDSSNNLLISGSFTGTINLGTQLSSQGQTDAFVGSMSQSGTWNWAKSVGGSSYDTSSGVVYDSVSGLTIMGLSSQSSYSFGSTSFTPRGYNDSVLVSFDSNGNSVALFDAGSTDDDAISGISLLSNGAIIVTGNYNGTIDFGSSSASTQTTSVLMPYVWFTQTVSIEDADGDGVADDDDNCPNTPNPGQENTDLDSEGDSCDSDDDNDGITDNFPDNCPRNSQTGWTSTRDYSNPSASTDWDNDGCKDDHPEDLDDDNDGVLDTADGCPLTSYNPPRPTWISEPTTDMDGDGCRDSDEDNNDDGDAFNDSRDDCPTTYGTSTLGFDVGCVDSDLDGWADISDDCPFEFGNSSENGKIGCLDSDGDGWANVDDDFDFDSTQWLDSDGDGYGDNQNGINPDNCIDDSGDSYEDRNGCRDSDGDGYSNPDFTWSVELGADAFVDDDKQWADLDGDGFGDNWGNISWQDRPDNWPGIFVDGANLLTQDACPFQAGNSTQDGIYGCPDFDGDGWYDVVDQFIFDSSQWIDSDGDGFGDNQFGNQPDSCLNVAGNSTIDRYGCVDSDGDGYSDPVQSSWSINDGADAFIFEPTQWEDTDVDGYGNNPDGLQPDGCVSVKGTSTLDRFGCPDFDEDGYSNPSDSWTVLQGADACYNVKGNSTNDRIGCYDSDGDGYSNTDPDWSFSSGADGYPDDPTRWGPPPESDSASSSTTLLVGGGILGLIVVLIVGLLFVRRNSTEQSMPFDQGVNHNSQAIVNNGPPVQSGPPLQTMNQVQPVAQNQHAMQYYQNLVAQGYPHEHAVAYTQQYYPQFRF